MRLAMWSRGVVQREMEIQRKRDSKREQTREERADKDKKTEMAIDEGKDRFADPLRKIRKF